MLPDKGSIGKDGVAILDRLQAVVIFDDVLCAGQIGADQGGLINVPTMQPLDFKVSDAKLRSAHHFKVCSEKPTTNGANLTMARCNFLLALLLRCVPVGRIIATAPPDDDRGCRSCAGNGGRSDGANSASELLHRDVCRQLPEARGPAILSLAGSRGGAYPGAAMYGAHRAAPSSFRNRTCLQRRHRRRRQCLAMPSARDLGRPSRWSSWISPWTWRRFTAWFCGACGGSLVRCFDRWRANSQTLPRITQGINYRCGWTCSVQGAATDGLEFDVRTCTW